jgi:hypothetical protein
MGLDPTGFSLPSSNLLGVCVNDGSVQRSTDPFYDREW